VEERKWRFGLAVCQGAKSLFTTALCQGVVNTNVVVKHKNRVCRDIHTRIGTALLSYSRCSWSTRLVCDPGPFTAIHHHQCLYGEAYRRCSPGSLMDWSQRYVLTRVIGSSLKSRSDLEEPDLCMNRLKCLHSAANA
jgi:hypothetical protein